MTFIRSLASALLAVLPVYAAGQAGCIETPSSLSTLPGALGCSQCVNYLLPGQSEPSPHAKYSVISDLPEAFCSTGILYASVDVLPEDTNGNPPLSLRTQTVRPGFTWIDDDFDVFLFHTVNPCSPPVSAKRIVIYVRNEGTGPVTITPRQAIVTTGTIGTVHQMESNLGLTIMRESWDTPIGATVIAPGSGEVVAYSTRFRDTVNTTDRSTNSNCFGFVRGAVANADPGTHPTQLNVYVIAIDGAAISNNKSLAEAQLGQSAVSGETAIDINTAPTGCAARRATGVHRTFTWRNAPVTINTGNQATLSLPFQMALWNVASSNCPQARQTVPMEKYPGYTRNDTVGNYHVDYRVQLRVLNSDPVNPRDVDLRFGKSNADIGLVWRVASDATTVTDSMMDAAQVRTGWAGPNQTGLTRSFLTNDGGPITIPPCGAVTIGLRMQVLGNSSLPFQLILESVSPVAPVEVIVDNSDPEFSITGGGWGTSANAGFYGTNSLFNFGGPAGTDRAEWRPNLPVAGQYDVYAWWVASSNRALAAPYRVVYATNTANTPMNQTANGGQWNLLGNFGFNAGTSGYVDLTDNVPSDRVVSADAIRWVYSGEFVPVELSAFGAE